MNPYRYIDSPYYRDSGEAWVPRTHESNTLPAYVPTRDSIKYIYHDRSDNELRDPSIPRASFSTPNPTASPTQDQPKSRSLKLRITPPDPPICPPLLPKQATGPQFKYKPLPSGDFIRLLTIVPPAEHTRCSVGPDFDSGIPLRCTLREVQLRDVVGRYDTLSYTWGSDKFKHAIQVNDGILDIRENLLRFLVSLASGLKKPSIELWTDAICIDQNNPIEKGHQVQLMTNIYASSKTTKVWLNFESDWSIRTILDGCFADCRPRSRITHPTEDIVNRKLRYGNGHEYHVEGSDSIENNQMTLDLSAFWLRQLLQMLRDPYWSRLWIVQEIILSHVIDVFTSKGSIPWPTLMEKVSEIPKLYRIAKNRSLALLQDDLWRDVQSLRSCRIFVLNDERREKVKDARKYERRKKVDLTALEVIKKHSACACSDTRDRVFGLLGLIPDLKIEPNYNMSHKELFHSVIQSHPAREVEEIARPLAEALEIENFSEPMQMLPLLPSNDQTVDLYLHNHGAVYGRHPILKWSREPGRLLTTISYDRSDIRKGDLLYSLSIIFQEPLLVGSCCLVAVRYPTAPEASKIQISNSQAEQPRVVGLVLRSPHTRRCSLMKALRRLRPLANPEFVHRSRSKNLVVRIDSKHFSKICMPHEQDLVNSPRKAEDITSDPKVPNSVEEHRQCCYWSGRWWER